MDKSMYKAQMDDIIKISVNNIYQSRGDRERDCRLSNHSDVSDKFITAFDNKYNGMASNYDALI
jgi:dGTPase